jgi:hypothetical protein
VNGVDASSWTPRCSQAMSSCAISDWPPHFGPVGPVSGMGGPPAPIGMVGRTGWGTFSHASCIITFGVMARPVSSAPGCSGW